MGFIVTFASATNPTAQISVVTPDASSVHVPDVTVEVGDVDSVHADAVRRGVPVVYPVTDEAWGVRRCFLLDPEGTVINVMQHRRP